jgi:hypothetical protein
MVRKTRHDLHSFSATVGKMPLGSLWGMWRGAAKNEARNLTLFL